MGTIKRTTGGSSGRAGKRRKSKRGNGNILLVLLALLLIIGAGTTLWVVLNNRQTLDGAKISEVTYATEQDITAVNTEEKQRYYSIETHKPEVAVQALAGVYDANIQEFRTQLQGLLDEKTLNRKDKAKLTIGFSAEAFEQYTTYTIHTEQYISEGNKANKTTDYRAIFDSAKQISAEELFKSGVNYAAKLSDLADADVSDLNGKLALTNEGLAVYADKTAVIDYTKLYKLMAITLPERYKPVEPTPIDPRVEKVVALTFDDGPYGPVTNKLLDLLDKYNAKATFYLVGYKVDDYPEVVRDIAARGHCIGIHSTDHKLLTKMTDEQITADIFGMRDKIEQASGVRPNTIRPVGGAVNPRIAKLLNMPVILWDCDPNDWKFRDADKISGFVLNNVKSGDIVLSHDLYETTYTAYEKIIPELAAQGYRFVTVEDLIGYTDGAYAGQIIRYRALAGQLREAGVFEQ